MIYRLRKLPTATLFTHTRFIDDWFSGKWYRKPRRFARRPLRLAGAR